MAACLEIATKQRDYGGGAKLAGTLEEGYAQSIMGATLKRRDGSGMEFTGLKL